MLERRKVVRYNTLVSRRAMLGTALINMKAYTRNNSNPHRILIDALAEQVYSEIMNINEEITKLLQENVLFYKAMFNM